MTEAHVTMFAALAAGLAGVLMGRMQAGAQRYKERAMCFRAGREAINEFYDLADRLLKEPELPDPLKDAIYDMTLAVTDKQVGQLSFDAMLAFMEKSEPQRSPAASGMSAKLQELRHTRADLYDDFYCALRAALASLMFSYGPHSSKVAIEFEATKSQSTMLALTSSLVRVVSDWIANEGGSKWVNKRVVA